MDERTIGVLSTAAVIAGLAVIQSIPRPVALRVQEWAKRVIAGAAVVGGGGYWSDTGDPGMLVIALLIVGFWLGRRVIARRRRARRGLPTPPDQRSRYGP